MVKKYVIDTNILLQNPESIFGFEDNDVIITGTTLQEIDSKKSMPGETGYNAREAIRILDDLRTTGNLLYGIKLNNGGSIIIEPNGIEQAYLPNGFDINRPDNKIISTCVYLSRKNREQVILVTSDISMRVSASIVLGAENVQTYKNVAVSRDNYTGHTNIDTTSDTINEIYANKKIGTKDITTEQLYENEFITLHARNQSALSVYQDGKLNLIKPMTIFGDTKPMNAMQTYAMWALTRPSDEIPLVILQGPAGTAKTYLSLAAGLEQTYVSQSKSDGLYHKMLISRPNSEAGDNGFGYLPGDLEDKMGPLLLPYFDNLETLLRGNEKNEDAQTIRMHIEDLFETGIVEVCALSYIRGRSLKDSYIICDEAQNATKQLIKDVVSRCGMGSKVILAGDIDQVDNPKLDKYSNGLVHAATAFKESPLACLITFPQSSSVRSPLAKTAIEVM